MSATVRVEYLNSPIGVDDSDRSGAFVWPVEFNHGYEKWLYEEWKLECDARLYELRHEPLFVSVDAINRKSEYEGENFEIPVKASEFSEFIQEAGVRFDDSITAWAMKKTATLLPAKKVPAAVTGRRRGAGGAAGDKEPKEAGFREVKESDAAWKGVWQNIMTKKDEKKELPAYSSV